MKRYLLDSGPLAAFLHNRKTVVDVVTPWIINHEVATSILVYAEVTEYIKGFHESYLPLVIASFYSVHLS